MVESGIEPIVVVRRLRWSDAKMIHTYAHLGRSAKMAQGKFIAALPGRKAGREKCEPCRPQLHVNEKCCLETRFGVPQACNDERPERINPSNIFVLIKIGRDITSTCRCLDSAL
jgi:hypothetical protein